jgi:hypothetical protein
VANIRSKGKKQTISQPYVLATSHGKPTAQAPTSMSSAAKTSATFSNIGGHHLLPKRSFCHSQLQLSAQCGEEGDEYDIGLFEIENPVGEGGRA